MTPKDQANIRKIAREILSITGGKLLGGSETIPLKDIADFSGIAPVTVAAIFRKYSDEIALVLHPKGRIKVEYSKSLYIPTDAGSFGRLMTPGNGGYFPATVTISWKKKG